MQLSPAQLCSGSTLVAKHGATVSTGAAETRETGTGAPGSRAYSRATLIGHVGLADGHIVQVLGIDQPHLEPIFPARSTPASSTHRWTPPHPGHPVLSPPTAQLPWPCGGRGEGSSVLGTATPPDPSAVELATNHEHPAYDCITKRAGSGATSPKAPSNSRSLVIARANCVLPIK
jgi:hypothetical protein